MKEVAQARPFEAVPPPFYFSCRTAPGLALEDRPVVLSEFAVEARVVRDDDHGVGHERGDGRLVDPPSSDHFRRDAGEGGDLAGIGPDGSLNDAKTFLGPTTRPSGR